MKFLTNIDLSGNQLQNAVIHNLATAPSVGPEGQIYFNTAEDKLYVSNGSAWISIAGDITGVLSGTTGQLTISNADGPVPTFNIVTGAVADGGTALATGDQIYDFVTTQIADQVTEITFSANTGSQVITEGEEVKIVGGNGIESAIALNGSVNEITIDQSTVSRTDTTSAETIGNGGTVDVVNSVSTDTHGNVTGIDVKTVTLPTSVTDEYALSVGTGAANTSVINLDHSGTGAGSSDSITISGTNNEISVSEGGDTITIGLADDVEIANNLQVYNNLDVDGDVTFQSDLEMAGGEIIMNSGIISGLGEPVASTDAATKNYVDVSIAGSGALIYQSGYNASTNTPNLDSSPSGIKKGFTYTVTADGSFFTEQVRVGDIIIAEQDDPTTLAHWTIAQSNVDLASTSTVGLASFSSSNFAVSGAGEVTIKNNGIILGTETNGDYVESITVGTGLDITTATGEGSTPEITLDLSELTQDSSPTTSDFLIADSSGNVKISVSDILDLASKTATISGDDTTTSFNIAHTFGTDCLVQVFDGGVQVFTEVTLTSNNVAIGFAVAPATGESYSVKILRA